MFRWDSFWTLQVIGWAGFGVGMTLSRVGVYPLSYMIAMKGLLTAGGFLVSLGLRYAYRRWVATGASPQRVLLIAVSASYGGAVLWCIAYYGAIDTVAEPLWSLLAGAPRRLTNKGSVLDGAIYNGLTLLAWSMLYLGIRFQQSAQEARERALRAEAHTNEAQLRALRYQLNPHLLFNTFNAISTLIVEQRNDDAADMIAKLSRFLRLTLATDMAAEVPLETELRFIRQYLEIEQVRFGDRVRVDIDVEEDTLSCLVPALILQPLVENSMKYAVAPRVDGGRIAIRAVHVGSDLELSVTDDGPGFRPDGRTQTTQVGLANTRMRLIQTYGGSERLLIADAPNGGCLVTVRIPYHTARAAPAP